jgi:Cysteine-rich secretory protein family
MAKSKKSNNKLVDTILKYYTPIAVILIVGIVGSFYLNFSNALYAGISGSTIKDQALRIHAERDKRGLKRYFHAECLNSMAESWSKWMATNKTLKHNPNLASQVSGKCGNWYYVGENVGYGGTSSSIFSAFMNSSAHKANIIDRDYNRMGVGAYRDSSGRLWVTQVFAKCRGCTGTWDVGASYPTGN